MTVTDEQFGERIRIARERFHLTQGELGEFVDLSKDDIDAIERDERFPDGKVLFGIAYALGRRPSEFFDEDFVDSGALSTLFRASSPPADLQQLRRGLQEGIAYALQFSCLESKIGLDRAAVLRPAVTLNHPVDCADAIRQGEATAAAERHRLKLGSSSIYRMQHLFETHGVGSVAVSLPEGVSGLTLFDPRFGAFVMFNAAQSRPRRRFSLAHEYGHVLMDRHQLASLSTIGKPEDLIELRADAFAASFLMPESGVHHVIVGPSGRSRAEEAALPPIPLPTPVGMLHVAAVAQAFEVSRRSALRRMKDLRFITDSEFESLVEQESNGDGQPYSTLLGLFNPPELDSRSESRGRMLSLAFEVFRQERISRGKLREIGETFGFSRDTVARLVEAFSME